MKNFCRQKNKGFIALMSAIIISVILLLIATNLSFVGFYSRFNILESEMKERSSALADACVDVALIGFAQNPSYSGNTNVNIGSDTCFISLVTDDGSEKVFVTRGIFSNTYTNLKVRVDDETFEVNSVEEIPTF
jgi:hypothetical protein